MTRHDELSPMDAADMTYTLAMRSVRGEFSPASDYMTCWRVERDRPSADDLPDPDDVSVSPLAGCIREYGK